MKRAAQCNKENPKISHIFHVDWDLIYFYIILALFYTNLYLEKTYFQPKAQNKAWKMIYEFLSLWKMFYVQPYTSTWIYLITLYLPSKCDSTVKISVCIFHYARIFWRASSGMSIQLDTSRFNSSYLSQGNFFSSTVTLIQWLTITRRDSSLVPGLALV